MGDSGAVSERLEHYLRWRCLLDDPPVELDLSHSALTGADLQAREAKLSGALAALAQLEGGAVANVDEDRMVGHFWLRAPGLAPDPDIGDQIARTLGEIEEFAQSVHTGALAPPEGGAFTKVLLVGIGGSALGPMLLADVFGGADTPMELFVLDNTDPEGIDCTLGRLGSLQDALVIVISKSGGTSETRNGMLEVERACGDEGLELGPRAVAITVPGSALDARAKEGGWIRTLPMWDWVGGRTSMCSAVGLLPGALLGMDLRAFLAGAAAMDAAGRGEILAENPAAALATFWHVQGNGRGERAMVVLPYKDRLLLLSRYLQQLVMESLGKKLDRQGKVVHQGIAVYGNKGSTDQHAFVQQLRDGRHDFFVQFVRVLHDRDGASQQVEDGATCGDFLDGFWQGTRQALSDEGRASATLTVERLDERSFGAIVALFERAVSLYAELIDVNAYHQPGVEAGKKAAAVVLALQRSLVGALDSEPQTCVQIAGVVDADPADAWPVLCHLAANRPDIVQVGGPDPMAATFARR